MAKAKLKAGDITFACRECGDTFPKWTGKCPSCGSWDSLVEFKEAPLLSDTRGLGGGVSFGAGSDIPGGVSAAYPAQSGVRAQAPGTGGVMRLKDVPTSAEERMHTGSREFDRVLGGGVVRGSLVLIGGDPGIGKSTLLLQVASTLTAGGVSTLYVTGEESLQQLRLRASRLQSPGSDLMVASETNLESIFKLVDASRPEVLVLDSIQTVYKPDIASSPGSPGQLREATLALMVMAKSRNCAVFLVGHVTKEGQLAGPRLLEHMVDTVIYFEGERHHAYRILRAVKNRFGATHEIGVFEMRTEGLVEVENPSEAFISQREARNPGSVVTCCIEGSRPLLIEVQALVGRTNYAVPQRVSMGLDQKRLTILLAILEKSAGIEIGPQDVFVNLAGGFRIDEPAIDLAVAAAVAGNHLGKPCIPRSIALGELGLNGELRPVPQIEARLKEAQRLGFEVAVIPHPAKGRIEVKGMQVRLAKQIGEACDLLFR
jgi:DNA repair protein RadA/Sms